MSRPTPSKSTWKSLFRTSNGWRSEWLWGLLVGGMVLLAVWWIPGGRGRSTDSYSVANGGKRLLFEMFRKLPNDPSDGQVKRSDEVIVPPAFYESDTYDRLFILGPARSPVDAEWDELREAVSYGLSLAFAVSEDEVNVDADVFGVRIEPFYSDEEREEQARTWGQSTADQTDDDDASSADDDGENAGDEDASLEEGDDGETVAEETAGEEAADENATADEQVVVEEISEWEGVDIPETATTDLVSGSVEWTTKAKLVFENPDAWTVLVSTAEKPQVAFRAYGDGWVVFSASDNVFANRALLNDVNAELAYRILEYTPTDGVTYFDETLNISGTPKVFGILFDPVLRPLTLQLLLLVVLFGWAGSGRFGAVQTVSEGRRRSVEEHAEALGAMYYRAGEGERPVQSLSDYLKLELIRVGGPTFHRSSADMIARRARMEPDDVRRLLIDVRDAKSETLTKSESAKLLRRISQLIHALRQ